MAGGTHSLQLQLQAGQSLDLSILSVYHTAVNTNQGDIQRRLNQRIAGEDPGETDNQRFTGYGIWADAIAVYNMFRYWDNFDYSLYPNADLDGVSQGVSPFTTARIADLDTYGAFGTALRIDRENRAALDAMFSDLPNGQRQWNRLILIATEATGYNQCIYAQQQGFQYLTEEVQAICAQYPDPPVPTQYVDMDQDIKTVMNQVNPTMMLFNGANVNTGVYGTGAPLEGPEVRAVFTVADIDPITAPQAAVGASPTLQLQTSSHNDAVAVYEIYRSGELLGYVRTGLNGSTTGTAEFVDATAPADAVAGDYTVVAYDYRLNASGLYAVYYFNDAADASPTTGTNEVVPFAKSAYDATNAYEVSDLTPTREGYTFRGWLDVTELSDAEIPADEDVADEDLLTAGDTISGQMNPRLLAIWEPVMDEDDEQEETSTPAEPSTSEASAEPSTSEAPAETSSAPASSATSSSAAATSASSAVETSSTQEVPSAAVTTGAQPTSTSASAAATSSSTAESSSSAASEEAISSEETSSAAVITSSTAATSSSEDAGTPATSSAASAPGEATTSTAGDGGAGFPVITDTASSPAATSTSSAAVPAAGAGANSTAADSATPADQTNRSNRGLLASTGASILLLMLSAVALVVFGFFLLRPKRAE